MILPIIQLDRGCICFTTTKASVTAFVSMRIVSWSQRWKNRLPTLRTPKLLGRRSGTETLLIVSMGLIRTIQHSTYPSSLGSNGLVETETNR